MYSGHYHNCSAVNKAANYLRKGRAHGPPFFIQNKKQNSRGFTLIELIVVLVVLAVLGSLATVKLGSVSQTGLVYEADRLHAHIKHVQNLALALNEPLQIVIDSAQQWHVSCVTPAASAPCDQDPIRDPALLQPYRISLPVGLSLGGSNLAFDSWGRPIDSTSGLLLSTDTVMSISQSGISATLSIEPLAGFVTVTL